MVAILSKEDEHEMNDSIVEAIGPPDLPLLHRINVGVSNAIHCVVFEFIDESRRGLCVDQYNEPIDLTDANIKSRGGEWMYIEEGDYIQHISGYNFNQGNFLCHSIYFGLKSGSTLQFESKNKNLRGNYFHFVIEEKSLLCNLIFLTNGTLPSIGIVRTTLHLPVLPRHASLLPVHLRKRLSDMLLILSKLERLFVPVEVRWR